MAKEFDIDALAMLAKIRLAPDEKAGLSADLEKILRYVAELRALDVTNVEPTTHALKMENVFRKDEAKPCSVRDQVLNHAPKREGSFFKVPKVVEREQ